MFEINYFFFFRFIFQNNSKTQKYVTNILHYLIITASIKDTYPVRIQPVGGVSDETIENMHESLVGIEIVVYYAKFLDAIDRLEIGRIQSTGFYIGSTRSLRIRKRINKEVVKKVVKKEVKKEVKKKEVHYI